jgi:WD40 repeat protein
LSTQLQYIGCDGKEFQDELIAVMTNNDHTVRIFSLTQSCSLDTLHFPTAMNHATISPDGSLLVAVGDEPHAYFHRRVTSGSIQVQNGPVLLRNEWQLLAYYFKSRVQKMGMCFTTAFSPSGHICAVASQHGIITIFDTSSIQAAEDDDDAIIEVFRSSRPSLPLPASQIGAPRSMCFSPAPWDLLAWAEDHGRVCVADARHAAPDRPSSLT